MTTRSLLCGVVVLLSLPTSPLLLAAELRCEDYFLCPADFNTHAECQTSKYWFEVESASGARGDVVGVTYSLHYAPEFNSEFSSVELVVCHDPTKAEIVGKPVYADEIMARTPHYIDFSAIREGAEPRFRGNGFHSYIFFADRSPVVGEMPLMTVYYRILGASGQTADIAFCDGQSLQFGLRPGSGLECNFNRIHNAWDLDFPSPFLSSANRNGTLTILDGPATHPDRPPEPPDAMVYSEPLTSEDVNLQVRIAGALASPGDRAVPIEVFVTADVEYTGVVIPIDFDERYVRVARGEDHFVSGTASVNNDDSLPGAQIDEGYAVIVSSLIGNRRVAAAGEEFHAVTLYVDVLDAAASVRETRIESLPVGGRAGNPFVIVRQLGGTTAEPVEVRGEFGAVQMAPGVLTVRKSRETVRGDSNLDGEMDHSDPISTLNSLYICRCEPPCPAASDYDGDGEIVIADAIRMLGVLFLGQPRPDRADERVVCR